MKIQSSTNNSNRPLFGMKFTPETHKLAQQVGGFAKDSLINSESLKSSENYLVHILPPEVKSFKEKALGLFSKRNDNSDYWKLCVSNKEEFPELKDVFYPFVMVKKPADAFDIFISDFFVKEKAYNALKEAAKRVANVEHPPFSNPSKGGRVLSL